MPNHCLLKLIFTLVAFTLAAQEKPGSVHLEETPPRNMSANGIDPGTLIIANLTTAIDTKTNKERQPVAAAIVYDIKNGDKILLPKGAKLIGRIVESHGHSQNQSRSKLALVFDKAILQDGTEIGLRLVIDHMSAQTPERSPSRELVSGYEVDANANINRRPSGGTPAQRDEYDATHQVMAPPKARRQREPEVLAVNSPSGMRDVDLLTEVSPTSAVSVLSSKHRNIKVRGGTDIYFEVLVP